MDPITASLFLVLFSILAYVVYQAWKVNKFFEERGVPHLKPWLFVGNAFPVLTMKMSFGERHKEICGKFPNAPAVGYYDFMKPTYLIQDPDWIEKIVIKDFVHFVDHGFLVDEDSNPLDSNLFTMTGKRWKACRNKLSPIFTTGKLKMMYDSMSDCGDQLVKHLEKTKEVEMRDVLGCFAMDVIGSCAFGIEAKNLNQPDNQFRRMGKVAFQMDTWQFIKFVFITNFPSFFKLLKISFNKPEVIKYFCGIINDTIKYRREHGYVRNDFLQLLMQIKDKGYVEVHTKDPADDYLDIDHNSYSTEKFELSTDQLTGQAFTFLTAGFEATAVTMTFTLYELSKNQVIQDRVREEILREVKQAGSLTYDALKEMTYLEQCVNEGLRKYPPAPGMFRVCTKEYTLPNGVAVQPGESLMITLLTLHHNPKYFPEPEKYKPERFDPDQTLPPCAFIPFGNGPRICIAMRFALMEIKYCLAKLLMNYRFRISPKTKEPIVFDPRVFFTAPKTVILFNVEKIAGK